MVTKKKAAPKRKAPPKKKAVKKYASKTKKSPVKKKIAPKKKAVAVPKSAKKKVPARQSARVHIASSKKKGPIKPTVKKKAAPKLRARQRKLGPIPKLHIDHLSWDKIAVMDIICKEMLTSSKGIACICSDNDDLPDISTVFRWFLAEDREGGEKPLCDMYGTSRAMQIDLIVDETIDIGDNQVGNAVVIDDVPVIVNGNIVKVIDGPSVQHAKLRCDNRRWIAEKLAHRKYGNKLELSNDPERPLSTQSDDEIEKRILLLQKKQAANGLNES